MTATDIRTITRTTDLPDYHKDAYLAAAIKPGDTLHLTGKPAQTVTHVEVGVNLDFKRRILVHVQGDTIPLDFSPREYLPVTPA